MKEKDWPFAPCLLSANLFVELTCQSLATVPFRDRVQMIEKDWRLISSKQIPTV